MGEVGSLGLEGRGTRRSRSEAEMDGGRPGGHGT
jgi:hypothetical protein